MMELFGPHSNQTVVGAPLVTTLPFKVALLHEGTAYCAEAVSEITKRPNIVIILAATNDILRTKLTLLIFLLIYCVTT